MFYSKRRFYRSRAPEPVGIALLLGIGAAVGAAAVYWIARINRPPQRPALESDDAQLDSALDATYPASDPPASHYTDIPVNRH
jgi:hypothetical protein